ncbi:MAG: erythromycin esterase family protein [Pirellulales bacterium]
MALKRRQGAGEGIATTALVDEVGRRSLPLHDSQDLDSLLALVGDSHFVLLGEASHGTSEYYSWRHRLSERLIREKGFSFIAVEGDWPDCYRVNRYVRGFQNSGRNAREVLHAFNRWPTWMWANLEVVELAEWLRAHNEKLPETEQVGFYGLDVYSLWDSMRAVIGYLSRMDGQAVGAALRAFECFEPYGEDVQQYARATMWVPETCEDEVVGLLRELRQSGLGYDPPQRAGSDGRESYFNAEQNALVAKNAERYYRTMVRGGASSWNVRDGHMVETLERLMRRHGPGAKAIVWEHNTHIGDARATDMREQGEVNVGQLVREEHGEDDVVLVGFSSHRGTVIAGESWDAPMEIMDVPPGRAESWEDVLHRAGEENKLLLLRDTPRASPMYEERGHRAIGVVYHPEYERHGNYVPSVMPRRYDALLFIDESHALHPLHIEPAAVEEVPETYPTGV